MEIVTQNNMIEFKNIGNEITEIVMEENKKLQSDITLTNRRINSLNLRINGIEEFLKLKKRSPRRR